MASGNNNPEIAQDVIRLLHSENKALRTQVQELEQQKNQNQAHPPSYDDAHVIETLRSVCQELQRERDTLRVELSASKRARCTDPDHIHANDRVEYLTQQLADITSQKQAVLQKQQLGQVRIAELERRCRKLEEENRLLQQSSTSGKSIPTSASPSGFDTETFLSRLLADGVGGKPHQYQKAFSNVLHLRLPKKASDHIPYGSMRYSHSEFVWKHPGSPLFLALGPMHVFNAKVNGGEGGWERSVYQRDLAERPNQLREIFFLHEHAWHYYGTYECVGAAALSVEQLEKLGQASLIAYAEKRTLLDTDRVAPHMSKLIHNMYAEGILKLEVFGYQRVGFNEALNAVLMDQGVWTQDRKGQRTTPTAPKAAESNANVKKQEQRGPQRADEKARQGGDKRSKGEKR